MRKISAILGTMLMTFFLANSAMAQTNMNAYFAVDTNITDAGYQGATPVKDIGPSANVGFALYSQGWDSAKGFTVHFEWDSTLATYRAGSGGADILDNDITINGVSIIPTVETNILGSGLISAGEMTTTPGKYEISKAQSGGTASTTAVGLIYFAVFRTAATFNTSTPLVVAATVTVADANAATKSLGTRYFYVNKEIDVKTSSWGEVKKQFKDF